MKRVFIVSLLATTALSFPLFAEAAATAAATTAACPTALKGLKLTRKGLEDGLNQKPIAHKTCDEYLRAYRQGRGQREFAKAGQDAERKPRNAAEAGALAEKINETLDRLGLGGLTDRADKPAKPGNTTSEGGVRTGSTPAAKASESKMGSMDQGIREASDSMERDRMASDARDNRAGIGTGGGAGGKASDRDSKESNAESRSNGGERDKNSEGKSSDKSESSNGKSGSAGNSQGSSGNKSESSNGSKDKSSDKNSGGARSGASGSEGASARSGGLY